MAKKAIARIRSNDNPNGEYIYILADTKTFQIEASNGEELPTLNVDNVADLFKDVYTLWGMWDTFEWLAEYNENTNEIVTTKDGWYTIYCWHAYVEQGKVSWLVNVNGGGTKYPYRKAKDGGWDNASGKITPGALRRGISQGRYRIM